MSGALSKRSDLANDNRCPGLSLELGVPPEPRTGPGGAPAEELPGAGWAKVGQDQNRNELEPGPGPGPGRSPGAHGEFPGALEPGIQVRNARNAAGDPRALLIGASEEEEEEDEDEEEDEEEEEDGASVSPPALGAERGVREPPGRSASRLFAGPGPGSDEDSSWATLSQGSPGSSPDEPESLWPRGAGAHGDLPPGWLRVQDTSGTYYWHVPTGTTQWEPPGGPHETPSDGSTPTEGPALSWTSFAPAATFNDGDLWKDPMAEEEEEDDEPGLSDVETPSPGPGSPGEGPTHPPLTPISPPCPQGLLVRSLGWVQLREEELGPGRSSSAVSACIRQLSGPRDGPPGTWGEARALLLLEGRTLKLVDPQDQALLHAQPVGGIRVWGVGRHGSRDFAYVARDPLTQVLKCHVFHCEGPASAIAAGLHRVCAQLTAERRSARAAANGLGTDPPRLGEPPLQAEFPAPKSEVVQRFPVCYLGCVPVAKPVG
ncbi:APBB1 protein, partial [Menura novaehollandiae]|nr:APBB1 protein [Menura novaehollandiae]